MKKRYCDKKINEEIKNKLIARYKFLFPKENKFYTNKLFIVLESFFLLK